ncbi:MAG: hypothetical protein JNG85_14665 [Spirochaetaceae bacterium]|nr:hypothetical protein [Spirochaetaceae bacterium]
MSAPVAYLRREAGALVAEAPLMPCEVCNLSELCGPDYPCPNSDPIVEEDDMAEVSATVLERKAEFLTPKTFGSLEELIAYSRAHPWDIVGPDDDPAHYYKAGERFERRKAG